MTRHTLKYSVVLTLACAGALLLAACGAATGGSVNSPSIAGTTAPTATAPASSSAASSVSLTALPLGDGHVSTTPKVGYVNSCMTTFSGPGGSKVEGPWIQGSTWNSTTKLAVQGSVTWSQATYSVQIVGSQRVITTKDLPVGFTTGVFPISSTDPAYEYDRNPNSIGVESITLTLPANPTLASSPTCVNMGPIGVLNDGVMLFNALDAAGRDAVAHEVLDSCGGHPDQTEQYHHHDIPPCLMRTATGASTLMGYANDGFGIYVERDANGNMLTNSDLDACHGRTSVVTWNGQQVSMYHYVATAEYPYTVGCFMGTPVHSGHP